MDALDWTLIIGTFALIFVASLGVMAILLPVAVAKETRLNCPDCKQFVKNLSSHLAKGGADRQSMRSALGIDK